MAVWIEYEGQLIDLPQGGSVVGRSVECDIRFNDPAISRKHIRLVVEDADVRVEDLSSSNGTWVNEVPVYGSRQLSHGDVVRVGPRRFRVGMGSPEEALPDRITQSARDLLEDARDLAEVVELNRDIQSRSPSGTPTPPAAHAALPLILKAGAFSKVSVKEHNCPRCTNRVAFTTTICPTCDYQWPSRHPSSPTLRIDPKHVDRRRDDRWCVRMPALYISSGLTFHGMTRDLSKGGVYVVADLLDPVGTDCQVHLLPDGQGSMEFEGVVSHVVAQAAGEGGRPPGMGIHFNDMSHVTRLWLRSTLMQAASTGTVEAT